MQKHILKCPGCGHYTMKKTCLGCNLATISSKPAKYSPEDKYAVYRRKTKKESLVKRGLL